MRTELKRLRVTNFLTQEQMAEKCGTSRNNYGFIEKGKRKGSAEFWLNLQKEFGLSVEQVEELRKVDVSNARKP